MAPFTPEQIKWLQDIFGACAHIVNAQTPGDLVTMNPTAPGITPRVNVCQIVTSHDVISYKKLQEMLQAAYTETLEHAYNEGTHIHPDHIAATPSATESAPVKNEVNIEVTNKE